MKKIKLGIYEELTLQLGTRQIGSVFPINAHEMVGTTMREIRRFEGEEIKECLPFTFSCACFIPEVEFVVGHTVSGSEMWVMRSVDIAHPILTGFKTGQTCVYHMIYSSKSKSIITIGSGIKVFTISWELKGSHFFSSNYEATIKLRSEFADDYDASLLNPPAFDDDNERLFLPTPVGICAFDLDGELVSYASKLPADNNTSYAFCQTTHKLLTFDPTDGLCLWKTDGTIDKRINITSLIIIGLRFIDSENVVCLNSNYSLHLLNIKTNNIFECFSSPPHTRLNRFYFWHLHYKPYVFMCYGNKLTFLRINLPWQVFSLGIVRPHNIQRYSKSGAAARIGILTDNSFVKLFSPKKHNLLVSLTPSTPVYPSTFFYDRGVFVYYIRDNLYHKYLSHIVQIHPENPRDFLYLVYEDGDASKFDVSKAEPAELWTKKLRAKIMSFVFYKEKWCFAISHLHGMLSFIDIESFEKIKEISLSKKEYKYMFFCFSLNCLIFLKNKSIKLFDLKTELFKYKLKIQQVAVASLFGDILYLGYDDGSIVRYQIVKWSLKFIEPEIMTNPHDSAVTSFDFSPNFYVSSSFDMTCVIWDYTHSKIIQLKVPFPIYSVAFHGVKRHLLIGSKDSVMMLQGDLLFGEENWDPELIGLDSYDLYDDKLDPHTIAIEKVEKLKEEAKEAAETAKKIDKSILNSTKKMALRRAIDEIKKKQDDLIEQFKKDSEMGSAAKTPEARQRTVDQMIQLLDLANNGENQAKQNAIKNAQNFIQQKDAEIQERKSNQENEENNNEEEESKNKKELKNSIKPKKFVSAADFIKQQQEIENKKKKTGKRKSKRKRNKIENQQQDVINVDDQNKANLLEMLNLKNQQNAKLLNKKSKVEIDISKMSFAVCSTENKEEQKEVEYEYYYDYEDDNENKKKKKKTSKNKKSSLASKKTKSLSKTNLNSNKSNKKSSQINLNEKSMTTSTNIQSKDKKQKEKNKSTLNTPKKSDESHESIHPIKNKKKSKISPKASHQSIDKLEMQNEEEIKLSDFLNNNKDIPQFMNYEYINDDGQIAELPEGQLVNDKGQIVNADGQLVDENGEIISDKKYRYRDKNGKICFFTGEEEKSKNYADLTNCIFVDDFGKVVNKNDVFLNEYGEYIDSFGELLTKISKDRMIISDDGQLLNNDGQKINAKGELIPEIEQSLYSEVACQVGEDNFAQRSVNSKIHKLTNFFNPKNRCYRPSTPPPIHWNVRKQTDNNNRQDNSNLTSNQLLINNQLLNRVDSISRSKRSRTPPQLRTKRTINRRDFSIPQPNCVLDSEAVLAMYRRGHVELLPIIFKLVREGTISPSKVPIPADRETSELEIKSEKLASPQIKKSASTPKQMQKEIKNKINKNASSTQIVNLSPKSPTKTFVKKSFSHGLDQVNNSKNDFKKKNDKNTVKEESSAFNQNKNKSKDETNKFIVEEESSAFNQNKDKIKDETNKFIIEEEINAFNQNKDKSKSKDKTNKFIVEEEISAFNDQNKDKIKDETNKFIVEEEENSIISTASEMQSDINVNVDNLDEEIKKDDHHIAFVLSTQNDSDDQIDTEIKISPTPPNQPRTGNSFFKRNSQQHPKPHQPSSDHRETPRRSLRRTYNKSSENDTTFQLTSSEILNDEEKDEVDFNPMRRRNSNGRRFKEEVEMIKQKRRSQRKQKKLKFEILGVPVYKKDVKNKCFPPFDHVEDQWPIALNQKGKNFEIPEEIIASEDHHEKLHNSDNSDDDNSNAIYFKEKNEEKLKFQATRSTRTTPNSLSMARFYDSQKKNETNKKKSIIDYSYLLEPGAVEEPKVADDIAKDFEDKEDILFSLRSMFPKTNQMAIMIQTPKSIQNTRYSRSLQEYSNEYMKNFHSKNIKVKKKQKK